MKKIDDLNDHNSITDSIDNSTGDLFNKTYYMVPGEASVTASTNLASKSTLTQMAPATTTSQNAPPKEELLQNMIGLSDLVYSSTDPNHALPSTDSTIPVLGHRHDRRQRHTLAAGLGDKA